MAKQIFFATPINTADADFRLWGKGASDAMTAVGFTKTADTGQIDWATVSKPASVSTYSGYEIREFSDDIQATNPIIVKIEYGCGNSLAYCAMRITVGRDSDGSGNLVGVTAGPFVVKRDSQGTSLMPCAVSGNTDRIEVALFMSTSSYNLLFWIERIKDDTGANTDTGVDIGYGNSTLTYQVFFPKDGLQFPLTPAAGVPCLVPYSGIEFSYVGNLGIFPVYSHIGYVANPNLSALIYAYGTISSIGSVISVTIFGVAHEYIITGCAAGTTNGNAGTLYIALRYE
jgi:hypothetical protein